MINKDCYIKKTEIKLFGKTLAEKVETFDNSMFELPDESAFYSVPKCFQKDKK